MAMVTLVLCKWQVSGFGAFCYLNTSASTGTRQTVMKSPDNSLTSGVYSFNDLEVGIQW